MGQILTNSKTLVSRLFEDLSNNLLIYGQSMQGQRLPIGVAPYQQQFVPNKRCPLIAVCIHSFWYSKWDQEKQSLKEVDFWTDGVTIPIIGFFGLIGNILTIITLANSPKNRFSVFYKVCKQFLVF